MTDMSIITATFNAEHTLNHCISSVMEQTLNVEHVIVDGGSTDRTMDIISERQSHIAQVISEKDHGIYDAMNKGINMVNGDVVGILNADDFYPTKDVLAKVMLAFDDPHVSAIYGDLIYVNARNREKTVRRWHSGEFKRNKFYWGWMPPHPTFFVRRELYEKYGGFNLNLGSAADYEIMLRFLVKNEVNVAYIPQTLVHMRVGGVSNASILNRLAANRMDRKAWIVNDLKPYPWTIIAKPFRKIIQWF